MLWEWRKGSCGGWVHAERGGFTLALKSREGIAELVILNHTSVAFMLLLIEVLPKSRNLMLLRANLIIEASVLSDGYTSQEDILCA
jgi:hypothetical protein